MDAVLTPHRSLSFTAFWLMLGLFTFVNVAFAIFFIAQGAFPVVGFLGLDVVALALAFYFNYKAAKRQERVRVAAEHILLSRKSEKGSVLHWITNPTWARVRQDADGVRIITGNNAMRVASFLSPKERRTFATALKDALWRANHRPSTSRME